MRVLIANDDGIGAPGLALLAAAVDRLTDDVWTVAPDAKRTAAGHSLTVARPLRMHRLGPQRYSCSGTPADCVVAAMTWLFRDADAPDLVISGVNDGPNVAEDIAYSGTLAIAREASFWGLPAIGLSRVKNADVQETDAGRLADLIESLWERRRDWYVEGSWLSLNLPQRIPAAVRQPRIGRDKIARESRVVSRTDNMTELVVPRGRAHASVAGDENSLLAQGFITLSRLRWSMEQRLDDTLLERL
ncbi:5'/3'-nucleotidase SurE [Pikeienuella piscinae]|uniref:5'-nucleotidase n=1 Tax=Pikeienuella piscinae TaxID=2748098 RepID=A0A7L5BSN2_9RHOB|nr:5'/3'-nucleotidase SurE [Pikeienuella piscinae]QIE54185.1 5'/3'-nucleotidase SurE [Pikeienuella piscinae]